MGRGPPRENFWLGIWGGPPHPQGWKKKTSKRMGTITRGGHWEKPRERGKTLGAFPKIGGGKKKGGGLLKKGPGVCETRRGGDTNRQQEGDDKILCGRPH